jgi:hypothetical protein
MGTLPYSHKLLEPGPLYMRIQSAPTSLSLSLNYSNISQSLFEKKEIKQNKYGRTGN